MPAHWVLSRLLVRRRSVGRKLACGAGRRVPQRTGPQAIPCAKSDRGTFDFNVFDGGFGRAVGLLFGDQAFAIRDARSMLDIIGQGCGGGARLRLRASC